MPTTFTLAAPSDTFASDRPNFRALPPVVNSRFDGRLRETSKELQIVLLGATDITCQLDHRPE